MRSGICPNCAAHTVFVDADLFPPELVKRHQEGTNTVVLARGTFGPIRATATNYVCITCGYLESYIRDPEWLAIIRERWTQVDSGS